MRALTQRALAPVKGLSRLIALSQTIGGALMLFSILMVLYQGRVRLPWWWIAGASQTASLAILGAYLWLRGSQWGLGVSIFIQALQVVQIVGSNFMLQIQVGIQLCVVLSSGRGISVSPGLYGTFGVWPSHSGYATGVGINLISIGALVMMIRSYPTGGAVRLGLDGEEVPDSRLQAAGDA